MKDNLESQTDTILTFLHLCEDDKHKIAVPLRTMDGAIPHMEIARSTKASEFLIPMNDGVPAVWPIDVKVVLPTDDLNIIEPDSRWPQGSLQFHRTTTLNRIDARQVGARYFSSRMLVDQSVTAMPDGTTISGCGPYSFLGNRWVPSVPDKINYPPLTYSTPKIQVALGWALAIRYAWTVWIGYSQGPRIRFVSDPLGAREVFRLRDIPQGRERRTALRHWVKAHWRQNRGDFGDEAWIRKHLRGATDFTWNGMRCRIQPADFDIEQMHKEKNL